MLFEQIVCLDATGLTDEGYAALQRRSSRPLITYADSPASEEELLRRIRGADCALVSWRTPVPAEVIRRAQGLRYIGMCCSLYSPESANVDIAAARGCGVDVRGVRDYGDEGVAEFILAQLICLYKGIGPRQWGERPTELAGKTMGVVGFGATGRLVARAARGFGMRVLYHSRAPKPDLETEGVRYAALGELLAAADVVTTHLPKHTRLLGAGELALLRPGAVLVNTSLGPTFDPDAFCAWAAQGRGYAIFDEDGAVGYAETFGAFPNVILWDRTAGSTAESRERLTAKVLANIDDFLAGR